MGDTLELQLKLEWAQRQLEERTSLGGALRRDIEVLIAEQGDLTLKVATLKTVQETLLREKIVAEKHVEQLMREKAELASENARLHVFAKDCAAKAASLILAPFF